MTSKKITELAIKRHDIDASHFQNTYTTSSTKQSSAFLEGRKLVIDELSLVLETLAPGSRVLDVGCGTAHLTNLIKEKGFEVYGIEPSAEMFNYAKLNFPDIEIRQDISSKISFPDRYFDLIVSFEVLRYLDKEENQKTYKEFYRVLKPGGRFFATQVNMFCTDFYFIFHHMKSFISKLTGSIHHHCNFTTPDEQMTEVKKAGFSEVETVGRFMGSIRVSYKLGKSFGKAYASMVKKIFKTQRFISFYKNFAAHLIVIAKKG